MGELFYIGDAPNGGGCPSSRCIRQAAFSLTQR